MVVNSANHFQVSKSRPLLVELMTTIQKRKS